MAAPPAEERLARLVSVRDRAKDLLGQAPARWENECEGMFKEFRLACVHLRRDQEVLDSLQDKSTCWRFICKFCRERPFQHDRCVEVLRILMLSDAWMREFVAEPEADVKDLPPSIAEEFSKRVDEVDPNKEPKPARASDPREPQPKVAPPPDAPVPAGPIPMLPAGMAVVVQRCTSARVMVDERSKEWREIGRGLVVSVSFAQKATEERVRSAARFLLTSKLSTGETWEPGQRARRPAFGSDAESVVELCKRGQDQGIVIIPQASLVANIEEKDLGLKYDDWCAKDTANKLYAFFTSSLLELAKELIGKGSSNPFASSVREPVIVAAPFTGRQFMDMRSAGPFMHSFSF